MVLPLLSGGMTNAPGMALVERGSGSGTEAVAARRDEQRAEFSPLTPASVLLQNGVFMDSGRMAGQQSPDLAPGRRICNWWK